jgi:hypothetical protein
MNCVVKALTRVLSCDAQEIYDFLGVTGQEIVFNNLEPPRNQRSLHLQEITAFCLSKNYAVIVVEEHPFLVEGEQKLKINKPNIDLNGLDYKSIYCGLSKSGIPHADINRLRIENLFCTLILISIFKNRNQSPGVT